MPFGKYRGEELDEIPLDYLNWIISEIELRPYLRSQVEAEIQKREQQRRLNHTHSNGHGSRVPAALKPWVEEIIARGFRAACFKAHPDQGGKNEDMVDLQQAREWLEELL